jgi:hypothetical protein
MYTPALALALSLTPLPTQTSGSGACLGEVASLPPPTTPIADLGLGGLRLLVLESPTETETCASDKTTPGVSFPSGTVPPTES